MLSRLWISFLLSLSGVFTIAWIVAVFHECGIRPVHELVGFFKKQPRYGRVFIGSMFLVLWILASVKPGGGGNGGGDGGGDGGTNNVQMVVGPGGGLQPLVAPGAVTNDQQQGLPGGIQPPQGGMVGDPSPVTDQWTDFTPITSTNTSRTLTGDDFRRGFVLTRVGADEAFDFSAPSNAVVCSDWRAFGAATDWMYLDLGDWAFQIGSNEVDRLRVHADGWVEAGRARFWPLKAPLGIVPEANWGILNSQFSILNSQFWHAVTPLNTLLLTWQNALLGRDTNTPVSVQMEIWPNGRFTYRCDLSRLDVEEVTNALVGASFGGLGWTTNAIPTNVTSLAFHPLMAEDATDPDRDGDGLAAIDEIFVHGTDPGLADTDSDGLSDPDEIAAGADPWNPDTDGDGLLDGEEDDIGTDPLSGDSDSDGVGDWQEVCEHGTDPLLADTDGDGLSDAVETSGATNPLKADTDDDAFDDPAEIQQGTDPNDPDTDGDGAPDGWEVANGSDPFAADTDGDGLSDGIEMSLGSSPVLPDADGDGFGDFEEFVEIGTSPALADTDGDGLSDWLEVDLMRVLASNSWVTAAAESSATIFAAAGGDLDDAIASTNLPFTVDICGVGFDRISIDTNGKVHLIPTNGTPVTSCDHGNKAPAGIPENGNDILIAPYWDDLMLRRHLASAISMGVDAECERIVVDYANVGLYDSLCTNAAATFQIVLSNDTNFPIRINYQFVSADMTGGSATIGVFDRRMADCRHRSQCRSLVRAHEEENAVSNGLSLGFRLGLGTDPLNADTDGDGLDDGGEFDVGSDPLNPDTDGDGLEDGAEAAAGSSPFAPDTDGDGMPDVWEARYELNPTNRLDASLDADGDGLSNLLEFQLGSSPRSADTDGDGRSDYDEHVCGTSPDLADTDGDGLDDLDEFQRGTSGSNPDSDNDGLPDGWEVEHGFNPLDSVLYGGDGDYDGDGLTNAEEYALGTDPKAIDTDGDGVDDGEEVGCFRTVYAPDAEWAATTNGWTAVTLMTEPGWKASYFSFDGCLRVDDEVAWDIICQWNGLLFLSTAGHYIDDLVEGAPVDLSGLYISDAAVMVAPYWTESVTNSVEPTISAFIQGAGGNVRYAVQYAGRPAGGTNTVSFQATFTFTNGVYKGVEVVYGPCSDGADGMNASVGVQDALACAGWSAGFCQFSPPAALFMMQFLHGLGTDPLNAAADADGDGISDEQELALGTDPCQPDTDGDGMNDGWEHRHGFNPLVNNDDTNVDLDETNDSDYDADGDGLVNREEADRGTDPHNDDTDDDGVADGEEVEQSSDPNDATDGGRPASRVPVAFNFGDPSGSHSEKYRLVVRPVKNPDGGSPRPDEAPKTFQWVNAEYGECETKTAMLLRGWEYEVRLFHASTDPRYGGSPRPDYDYSLSCSPPSCVGVVTNDPQRLFGENQNSGDSFEADGKVAHVLVLDGCIVGDYDRRDGFTGYDLSRVYRGKPLRHWINDDDDYGDVNEGDEDVPGLRDLSFLDAALLAVKCGREPDYYNGHVDGKSDILDFTPVWMDMGHAIRQLVGFYKGTTASDYMFTLSQPEGAVNIVWTSLTTNNVSQFLSTAVSGCGKGLNDALEEAGTEQLTEEETKIPGDLLAQMLSNRAMGIFLFEGRALREGNYHGTKHIILRCYRRPCTPGDGSHLFELKLPISVSPVEDMFRWIDERWVCGTNGIPSRTSSPWNNPDSECDGRHFIFVHGYSVSTNAARGWAAEMFKRLRQSGSRSMFTAVDWFGDDSLGEVSFPPGHPDDAPNYYANVEHAFATALQFAIDCEALLGQKIILAHSLGNMLVSSAIKDHDLVDYKKYYMLNAAVPMEAYDKDAYADAMVDHDWRGVTNLVYASEWNNLFPDEDGRNYLSWRGMFMGITNAINCYSTSEDTLGNAGFNESLAGKKSRGKFWAIQEALKGTKYVDVAPNSWGMNCEGGWGYNPHYITNWWYVTWPNRRMTDRFRRRIGLLTRDDLVVHPVFNPFDEDFLFTTNQVSLATVSPIRSRILADGVPALSFAAGANPLDVDVVAGNINYSNCKSGSWPRRDGRWLHSDIKKVAFIFNWKFFTKLVQGENE